MIVRGAAYADVLRYQQCISLWTRALTIRIKKETILHNDAYYTAQTLVKLMVDYDEKIRSSGTSDVDPAQRFRDTVAVFNLLTHDISREYLLLLLY